MRTRLKDTDRIPSAKSCRNCDNYQRGQGNKSCLRCRNYKLLDIVYDLRSTINIVPMVSTIIEAVPSPLKPDNALLSIIWSLPAQHAAMIGMHYYAALSIREIATVMRISEPAARAKLYRATEQLGKKINQSYPDIKTKLDAKMQLLLSPI